MKDEELPNDAVVCPSGLNEKSAKRKQAPIVPKMQNFIEQQDENQVEYIPFT